jgi:hypothetical protein
LKRYKSPGNDQALEDWFKQEMKHYGLRSILINSIWNKQELHDQWRESIIVHKKGDKTDCS